ncbi:MAG: hypothetical protein R3B13_09465 [Polyangiaceae bacterium]
MGLSLVALNVVGCAQERDPINRVQADALSKDFFVGKLGDPSDDPEFFWRNFVVDGSEAQSMVGIGSWGAVDRIRWEITENLLIARKSYPISDGADDKGPIDKDPADGTIMAAYPILKHFDVKKAYNPQTGEDLNIIEENSSDRVWYERSHMRVDWSINVVESPIWFDMFLGKIFGDISVTPIAYYVNDRNHPDAVHFEPDQGYFDVTNKFWVEPEATHMWGMSIPTCMIMGIYTGAAVDSCDKQEAVVRSSYWKVDSVPSAADFEPFENTYANLDIIGNPGGLGDSYTVGIVTPPRIDWDPQYGYTDAGMRRHLHHHNIWKQSHVLTDACRSDADCKGGACLPVADGGGAKACTVPCNYDNQAEGTPGTNAQCGVTQSVVGNGGRLEVINLVQGSQCSSKNWCTLPVRNRTIKPVGYWMNRETPAELSDPFTSTDPGFTKPDGQDTRGGLGETEHMIESWNQLMSFSVAKAREVECRRTGGDRAGCMAQYFVTDGGLNAQQDMVKFGAWLIDKIQPLENDVLVTCHNPVRSYDNPICGKRGYSARVGDVRHNFIYYWPYASRAPWGGIANWNADPLTGMIIGASATTMGRSATYAAAMVRDIIMVANGELTFDDITDGTPAQLYERRLQDGRVPETFTKAELKQRVDNIDALHAAAQIGNPVQGATPRDKSLELMKMRKDRVAGIGPSSTSHLEYEAIADKVRGSVLEAQMVTPNWVLDAAGMNPKTTSLSDVMDVVSPLRGMDYAQSEYLQQLIDLRMQSRGVCFPDIYAGNVGNMDVQGVAKYFKAKYSDEAIMGNFPDLSGADALTLSKKRAELIYTELWKETYKGIQLHEVGHSLGMLHQFASSYDSLNFLPQYWQLRTNETALTGEASGGGAANCKGAPQTDGKACMGPRYLDPETADELGQDSESRPGISYFGHTSTMEYQNERFFENVGLGQYDLLTMNVLYGRLLQAFDYERGYSSAEVEPFAYRNWTQLTEDNLVVWANPEVVKDIKTTTGKTLPGQNLFGTAAFLQGMHYTEQARRLKAFDPARCRDATDEERALGKWRIVHGKVCAPPPKDFARWSDFESSPGPGNEVSEDLLKWKVRSDISTAPNAVRWPYRWGTTSNSYPHTNPSDAGADIYEVTKSTIEKFDYQYPFTYFRRKNRDWAYYSIPSRVSRGFYERLRAFHWSMAIDAGRLGALLDPEEAFVKQFGFNASEVDEINAGIYKLLGEADNWGRPQAMAANDIFNAITRAFLMPQIGSFGTCNPAPGASGGLLDADCGSGSAKSLIVDASTGRYIDPDFVQGPYGGGSWDYQSYLNHAGYTFEKSDASRALTDGRAVFFTISRDNYLDGRNVNVNFRTDMPQAIDRLLGGVLSSDFETVAPFVVGGSAIETAQVQTTNLFGNNPVRPQGARALFPNVGYKQQVGTLVFAHIFARLNGDMTLSNKMRIWIDGQTTSAPNVPAAEQMRFYNPESGFTYVARKYGDDTVMGKTVDKGIASRMIRTANLMLAKAYEVQGGDANPTLDANGMATLVLDGNGAPIKRSEVYAQQLRSYVGLLDAAAQLGNMVGYGPFNGWGSIDLE